MVCNPEEQNRRHAANIEALARKHLAGIWKEWWLLDGLLALPRAEVIAMLNRTRGGRIRDELADHSTRIWLDRLLSVDSADERSVVERHPDLLDPLATEILRQAIEAKRGDAAKLQSVSERLTTKTGPYEDQMFVDQLSNVNREISEADQKLGASAFERFNQLMKEWTPLKADAEAALR